MKEIGGYIELDTYNGAEYHPPQNGLNCGRNALAYLFESRNINKLYIPYYLCDSVRQVCEKHGIQIEYYHIDRSFRPLFDGALCENEYLYIVNYYGQISNQQITEWRKRYARIIIDNAQAFFQLPVKGVDTIYTCRKFFGVPDGAYLYTDSTINRELETDISFDRMRFLFGRYEKSASEFYPEYVKNNQLFANEPLKKMSKLTHNLLRAIDYEHVSNQRTRNFEFLHQALAKLNGHSLTIPDGSFMYPLLIMNGNVIRNQLRANMIYIPVLWPNVNSLNSINYFEQQLVNNVLAIPCDQRYNERDMKELIVKILPFLEGNH